MRAGCPVLLVVRIKARHRLDVGALAIGFGADLRRAVDCLAPLLEHRGGANTECKRIAPAAERDTPFRDRAGRIGLQRRIEPFDRSAELERVEERDAAVELRLRQHVAGG